MTISHVSCHLVGLLRRPTLLTTDSGDLAAVLDHVDYAVKKFGVEHVAIGTDVAHTSQHAAAAAKQIPPRGGRKARTRFEALWPEGALGGQWPRAASLGWTNWPLITVGLVQRGYKEDDIRKILGGNVLRVCRDVLPAEMQSPS